MMPHPERCSEEMLGGENGRLIFESVISWLDKSKLEPVKKTYG